MIGQRWAWSDQRAPDCRSGRPRGAGGAGSELTVGELHLAGAGCCGAFCMAVVEAQVFGAVHGFEARRDLLVALLWQVRDNRENEPAADRRPAAAGGGRAGGGSTRLVPFAYVEDDRSMAFRYHRRSPSRASTRTRCGWCVRRHAARDLVHRKHAPRSPRQGARQPEVCADLDGRAPAGLWQGVDRARSPDGRCAIGLRIVRPATPSGCR
jgi:hypothetical protein